MQNDDETEREWPKSRFAADDGGPLPFEVTTSLELHFLLPLGTDLTAMETGEMDENGRQAADYILEVPPNELARVALLFRKLSDEMYAVQARRDLQA